MKDTFQKSLGSCKDNFVTEKPTPGWVRTQKAVSLRLLCDWQVANCDISSAPAILCNLRKGPVTLVSFRNFS